MAAGSPTSRRVGPRTIGAGIGVVLVAVLWAIPTVPAAALTPAAPALPPRADIGPVPLAGPRGPLAPDPGLWGSAGASGPALTPAQLALRAPIGTSAIPEMPRTPAGSPAAVAAPSPRTAPHPQGSSVGWFSGWVNDSTSRTGLAGASVTSSTAVSCGSGCGTVVTGSRGNFTLPCNATGGLGSDYTLTVDGPGWWTNNLSYDVCVAGSVTNVGTIFLVRDGVAEGVVRDAASGAGIGGITVSAISRDGAVVAIPTNSTLPNGTFLVPVPPEPSQVDFTPPYNSAYLATFNYTNATPGTGASPPWSNPVPMGTIYLSRDTIVQATLVNAVTGAWIGNETMAQLQACDPATGVCGTPGAEVENSRPKAAAPPGPAYFRIDAVGYTEGFTATETIPPEPPGTVYSLGRVPVTPFGGVTVDVNFTEPTGGSLPWPAPPPGSDWLAVGACSLDGYRIPQNVGANLTSADCLPYPGYCVELGVPTTLLLPPLRDGLTVTPAYPAHECDGDWAAPPSDPAIGPTLNVNVTGGHTLSGTLAINLTIGDYVAGRVEVAGTSAAPSGCFTVSAVSTDSTSIGKFPPYWDSCGGANATSWEPCDSLGNLTAGAFCVPVPPGNSELVVASTNYSSNQTWVHVPSYCCRVPSSGAGYPASLAEATSDHETTINVTPLYGNITGWAVSGLGDHGPDVPVFGVTVCPAFAAYGNCGGTTGRSGRFTVLDAPAGLDQVEVEAEGYSPDGVWVNVVPGANVSAGTVPIAPYGTIAGSVVDPTGAPIPFADVLYCTLAQAETCLAGGGAPLGTGATSESGVFNGTVPGGWLPGATYVVAAYAAGYAENWEYANASSGGFVTLPPLTLPPIGSSGRPAGLSPARSGPSAAWVAGRLIDSVTGAGVSLSNGGSIAACPIAGGLCTSFSDGSNTAGYFNGSVAAGLYDLNISDPGYAPASFFLNATGTGYVDLGNLALRGDWWVSGRIGLEPWGSVSAGGGAFGSGYAPAALVQGCDGGGGACQLELPVAQNGSFNVTIPEGTSAAITVTPPAGLEGNRTSCTVSGPYTHLTGSAGSMGLAIFGTVSGRVLDGDTGSSASTEIGLPYASVLVTETGAHPGSDTEITDANGYWTALVPGGNGPKHTHLLATDSPGFDGAAANLTSAVTAGADADQNVTLSLSHYGWIVARFVASGSGDPVAAAAASVSGTDPGTFAPATVSGTTNLFGWLNLSAPPGSGDALTVSATLANTTTFTAGTVKADATTFLNGSGYGRLRPVDVASDGFVRSEGLEIAPHGPPLGSLPAPTIVDPVNGQGIEGATIAVFTPSPTVPGGASLRSNVAGQFDANAPPGRADTVLVEAGGYVPNATVRSVGAGAEVTLGAVNLTGYAVVAGTVLSRINGTPVADAPVALCGPANPYQPACQDSATNASGVFWGTVAPGHDSIWVNASGYVANGTNVVTCPDCWISLGTIRVAPDGGVEGTVRALPSGFPFPNASVSLCPSDLFNGNPCPLNVSTGPLGTFFVPLPPGAYELIAYAPYYNETLLSIRVSSGEIVDVGTVFLSADGNGTGKVVDALDGGPIANASVLACPDWSGGGCLTAVASGPTGVYNLTGPPGPYELTVYASGYAGATAAARLVSDALTELPTVRLFPIGDNTPINLSGRVVLAGNDSRGVAGADVAALVGAVVDYSTTTDAQGDFVLPVDFGSYRLVARSNGYGAAAVDVEANRSLSGILLTLSEFEYPIQGVVTDGLTGERLGGVRIVGPVPSNATAATYGALATLGTTGPPGNFSIDLPNGTYALAALAPAGAPIAYPPLLFTVEVNGAGFSDNLTLTPPRSELTVVVEAASTGLPIPGASVLLEGTPEPGHPYRSTFVAGGGGTVTALLYDAGYLVLASAPGYLERQAVVAVANGSTSVTLALALANATSIGTSSNPVDLGPAAAIGVAAAAVGIAVLWLRRPRRAAPSAPPPVPSASYAPPEEAFDPETPGPGDP